MSIRLVLRVPSAQKDGTEGEKEKRDTASSSGSSGSSKKRTNPTPKEKQTTGKERRRDRSESRAKKPRLSQTGGQPVHSSFSTSSIEPMQRIELRKKSARFESTPTVTTLSSSSSSSSSSSHHGLPPPTHSSVLVDLDDHQDFCDDLEIRADHLSRPIWILPNKHFLLETFSPIYQQAYDFMIAIAEPVSRPEHIQEYVLTQDSLSAAVSSNLTTEDILETLDRLSKSYIPQSIKDFIQDETAKFGKLRLVLQSNGYFVESEHPEVLRYVLEHQEIRECRQKSGDFQVTAAPDKVKMSAAGSLQPTALTHDILSEYDLDENVLSSLSDQSNAGGLLHSFELIPEKVETARRLCRDLGYPMMQEYNFRNDTANPNINIDLKPSTIIRDYQEKSLSKMFGNGRARSGIIVLPCGAGKSLVGITACCTIKKYALVLCPSGVSVEQWKHQFRHWTTLGKENISRFTSSMKELDDNQNLNPVVISTYSMVGYGGTRSETSERIMKLLCEREWGILVLDEVHVVPADTFRKVVSVIKAHCKLGLTATLVREDKKIADLNYLLGPKLYEANWVDLQKRGYLARVQCAEVWCPMSPDFYEEYIKAEKMKTKNLLWALNPNKMRACEFLIKYHEKRGDRVIVFSDSIMGLETYAKKFGKSMICGSTHQDERMKVIENFRHHEINTFFISKVGDEAIDLPDANVIIQVSSHYGARRQEAQRLGRILRPKSKSSPDEFNAYFYSLVSQDTQEMYFATKRQSFLVDQGYSFKIITNLEDTGNFQSRLTPADEKAILKKILTHGDDKDIFDKLTEDQDLNILNKRGSKAQKSKSMSQISGGGGRTYAEQNLSAEMRKRYNKHQREERKRQEHLYGHLNPKEES